MENKRPKCWRLGSHIGKKEEGSVRPQKKESEMAMVEKTKQGWMRNLLGFAEMKNAEVKLERRGKGEDEMERGRRDQIGGGKGTYRWQQGILFLALMVAIIFSLCFPFR